MSQNKTKKSSVESLLNTTSKKKLLSGYQFLLICIVRKWEVVIFWNVVSWYDEMIVVYLKRFV